MTQTTTDAPRRRRTQEDRLIASVQKGLDNLDDGPLMAGYALIELREADGAPKKDLSRQHWDTWLKETFAARIGHATASKWMTMARWDAKAREELGDDRTVSIRKHLPPRWTSQYDVMSKTFDKNPEKDSPEWRKKLAEAVSKGEITPDKTAKEMKNILRLIRGEKPEGNGGDAEMITVSIRKGTALHTFYLMASGNLNDVAGLSDEELNEIGHRLAQVLSEVQREALRDLLADAS